MISRISRSTEKWICNYFDFDLVILWLLSVSSKKPRMAFFYYVVTFHRLSDSSGNLSPILECLFNKTRNFCQSFGALGYCNAPFEISGDTYGKISGLIDHDNRRGAVELRHRFVKRHSSVQLLAVWEWLSWHKVEVLTEALPSTGQTGSAGQSTVILWTHLDNVSSQQLTRSSKRF